MRCWGWRAAVVATATVALACRDGVRLSEMLQRRTPHESYADQLLAVGLDSTALGADWLAWSRRVFVGSPLVALPYREEGQLPADEATAAGYRLTGRRGERLIVAVGLRDTVPIRLFLDLFHLPHDTARGPGLVASAAAGSSTLVVELDRDGEYLLRLQPELLRGGRFRLDARVQPTLAFPIPGGDSRAIRSRWGAERDAGRRRHEGVDIFAPRGTPAVAATGGVVRSAGVNRLGGNVVWLYDEARDQSLYYAHLDRHAVQDGERISVGDTLGFVGNTGNARTTPPHLHFGIYRRGEGAIDPYPFVHAPDTAAAPLAADTALLGLAVRTRRATVLRAGPTRGADTVVALPRHALVEVSAATAGWYRVRGPGGSPGFLAASLAETAKPEPKSERPALSSAGPTPPRSPPYPRTAGRSAPEGAAPPPGAGP